MLNRTSACTLPSYTRRHVHSLLLYPDPYRCSSDCPDITYRDRISHPTPTYLAAGEVLACIHPGCREIL